MGIIESIFLLIYDMSSGFNKIFYGYENLQTVIYLLATTLLTAAVIALAAVTKKRKQNGKSIRGYALALSIADAVLLLYLTYCVINNVTSDLAVYNFTDIAALISYIAQALLLTVVSGDLLSIIGAGILLSFGFKNAKK